VAFLRLITRPAPGEAELREPVAPPWDNTPLPEIAARFLAHTFNFLPVVDGGGRLLGLIALQDLKAHLGDSSALGSVIASDVMRPAPVTLTPNQSLADALPALLASEQRNIRVVSSLADQWLVGSVLRAEALGLIAIGSRWQSK
jgi:CBS domain-containing protein